MFGGSVSRFAKLPLVLLAALALFFLMPGLARAESTTSPADACVADPTAAGCPTAGTGTRTGTDTGTGTGTGTGAGAASTDSTTPAGNTASAGNLPGSEPAGAGEQAGAQRNAVVPQAATDIPPLCTGVTPVPGCIPPCTVAPFKGSPLCTTPTTPPSTTCEKLGDLPHCVPDCAFLNAVLGQDLCTTTLPTCLDLSKLPSGTPPPPVIPGLPVCDPGGHTTPPPTSPGGVFYKNCDDARAHGATNIRSDQPGYRPGLDRDGDGVACEDSTPTGTPQTPTPQAPAAQPTATPVVDQLAYTGAVPGPITAAGFGLVLGGATLLRLSRRTR
jgi:hypothetical protein